jgi:hypothetical protein
MTDTFERAFSDNELEIVRKVRSYAAASDLPFDPVAIAHRAATQHRAASPTRGRLPTFDVSTRLAVGLLVATLVVAGGSSSLVALWGGVAGTPAPPSTLMGTSAASPSLAPSPGGTTAVSPMARPPVAPSSDLKTYTSPRYGYSIRYPANWSIRGAAYEISPIDEPYDSEPGVDYLSASAPLLVDPNLVVAAPKVDAGVTLDDWVADIDRLIAGVDPLCASATTTPVQIDGQPGRLITLGDCPKGGYLLWAAVVHGGRAYEIIWGDEFARNDPTLRSADTALFMKILESFRFQPDEAPSR